MGVFDLLRAGRSNGIKDSYRRIVVRCKGRRFRLDIADTFAKTAKGLMGRSSLPARGGMLFEFDSEGRHGFWMLGMKISIDIIWLDRRKRVVHIWRDAQPCTSILSCRTVKPERDALYVIELKAGTSERLGIRAGSRFEW